MKVALTATTTLLVGLTMLPALLANGDPPQPAACGIPAGPTDGILEAIRALESGGDYTAHAARSTASGAYQIVDATWNHYGGYRRAGDAPAGVQDAKAAELVDHILATHDDDIAAVPVVWYLGHLPADDSAEWDTVPVPHAGNTLTPRQYQQRWLNKYRDVTAAPVGSTTSPASVGPGSCSGETTDTVDGDWALPGPRQLIESNLGALTAPHHDYPAWDWIVPANTPIYTVRGGTITTVHQWPHNWWDNHCGTNSNGCQTCGVGVTILDADRNRWTYCHGTNVTVILGQTITAGQQIMWSGNTGRSGTPHLHIEIRTPDGTRECPQPLLVQIAAGATPELGVRSECVF